MEEENYKVVQPDYLKISHSLIEDLHTDLPNPYYQHQQQDDKFGNDDLLSLPDLINRIINEKGSFVNITEESIKNAEVEETNDTNEVLSNSNGTGANDINNALFKEKDKLIQLIHTAKNSSSLSLDFISLLISSVRPTSGSSTMSTHLKQHIKIGSLSCDKLSPNVKDFEAKSSLELNESMKIGRGWKLQSLKNSSKTIKNATEKLSIDIEKEKNYWNSMLNIVNSNEIVTIINTSSNTTTATTSNNSGSNMNNNNSASATKTKEIGVKYGYGDSGSLYFDKGIGILRKDSKSGELVFEKIIQLEREKVWGGDKVVSIKIFEQKLDSENKLVKTLVGESNTIKKLNIEQLVLDDDLQEKEDIVNKIRNARFFNFESELYWQILKEAAGLVSLQVKISNEKVLIDFNDELIEIEAVEKSKIVAINEELPFNLKADKFILFLRLMLCNNHYKNLQKKKYPPVSLNHDGIIRKEKYGFLLRPIIMYKKHHRLIAQVKKIVFSTLLDLDNGLDQQKITELMAKNFKLLQNHNDPNRKFHNSQNRHTQCYNSDPFIRCGPKIPPISIMILDYMDLKLKIELVSSYSTLHVSIKMSVTRNHSRQSVLDCTFNDKRDFDDCLHWVLTQ